MVDMGDFGNKYVSNLQVLLPLVVAIILGLPVFGYAYNKLMDGLKGKEHTSFYVAGGVLATIAAGALFSWKSALLFTVLFALDGIFMIVGEFKRTEKQAKFVRRKRLPYVANALLDEAKMAGTEARARLGKAIKSGQGVTSEDLHVIEHEINTVMLKILEVQKIQVSEK